MVPVSHGAGGKIVRLRGDTLLYDGQSEYFEVLLTEETCRPNTQMRRTSSMFSTVICASSLNSFLTAPVIEAVTRQLVRVSSARLGLPLLNSLFHLSSSCEAIRSGELRKQKLKLHLVRTQSLNVLPLKPGIGRYIAIHATLTAN